MIEREAAEERHTNTQGKECEASVMDGNNRKAQAASHQRKVFSSSQYLQVKPRLD